MTMHRMIWIFLMVSLAVGGCDGGDEVAKPCVEPGDPCNDGLCSNGAADGVCDQNGQCRTEPMTSGNCVVFLTKGTYGGDLGGLEGADAICQSSAKAAELPGTFKAWLSNANVSAGQRLTHSIVEYVDRRGRVIANDWADLTDGSLQRAITVDEEGYDWDSDAHHCGSWIYAASVWTGSTTGGDSAGPFCTDWTDASPGMFGRTGEYCDTSGEWTSPGGLSSGHDCSASMSLYCVQQ